MARKIKFYILWMLFYISVFSTGFFTHSLREWVILPATYIVIFGLYIRTYYCKICRKYLIYATGNNSLLGKLFPVPPTRCLSGHLP